MAGYSMVFNNLLLINYPARLKHLWRQWYDRICLKLIVFQLCGFSVLTFGHLRCPLLPETINRRLQRENEYILLNQQYQNRRITTSPIFMLSWSMNMIPLTIQWMSVVKSNILSLNNSYWPPLPWHYVMKRGAQIGHRSGHMTKIVNNRICCHKY